MEDNGAIPGSLMGMKVCIRTLQSAKMLLRHKGNGKLPQTQEIQHHKPFLGKHLNNNM